MTLKEAYEYGVEKLQESGIEDAKEDSFYLLEFVTGVNRGKYYTIEQQEMTPEELREVMALIQKRSMRIPLQHLIGSTEFMGLPFQVNPHVLIPRQDTELLVETALEKIEEIKKNQPSDEGKKEYSQKITLEELRILDMCTGSGCILISILHYATKKFPKIKGVGVDISHKAIEVAEENARKNGLSVIKLKSSINVVEHGRYNEKSKEPQMTLVESDLFARLNKKEKFHLIVSNPPYIPTKEIESLQEEVRDHDPILALDGKEDGLTFYRKIIAESSEYLTKDGFLMVECGWNQGEAVSQMMIEMGFSNVKKIKDLNGQERVVIGRGRALEIAKSVSE